MHRYTRRFYQVVLIAAGLFTASANASLIWEFGFEGDVDGYSGAGTFELGGVSSDTSDLLQFSFSGIWGDIECELGLEHVETLERRWNLNSEWQFTDIFIGAGIQIGDMG